MRTVFLSTLFFFSFFSASNAQYYFPPNGNDTWETTDPAELGWCTVAIQPFYDFLEENNTKSFILLKDGKIVLEQYFNGHGQDSAWYWASAGKTLTSFLVGMAQEEGALNINDATSDYLGEGWTSCDSSDEATRTIWHQLTMTTAFDDADNFECTQPECLNCIGEPGDRWSYHNGPYRLLRNVVEEATGVNYNIYTFQKLLQPTGMSGLWLINNDQLLFVSKARSMARFGSLIMNAGEWNGNQIMSDMDYIQAMTSPSQELNKSYGYLWWLNGQESHMLPSSQLVIPGHFSPNAPEDLVVAAGKNGQFLDVIPSEGMVVVRMGEAPDGSLVPIFFHDEMWVELNKIMCTPTAAKESIPKKEELEVIQNPFYENLTVKGLDLNQSLKLIDFWGREVAQSNSPSVDTSHLPVGIYFLQLEEDGKVVDSKRVVK